MSIEKFDFFTIFILYPLKNCVIINKNTVKRGYNMPVPKSNQKAVAKYMKNHYDDIKVRVPKGQRAEIQAHAEKQGETTNGFINRAIKQTIDNDNKEDK